MPTLPYQPADAAAYSAGGGVMFVWLLVYVYFAYALMKLSEKTKTPHGWWSWVPILNMFQFVKLGGKSYWWILLFFIPLVNLIVFIYLWMEIARRRGFDKWLGLLMIIPIANIILPGYLAFSEPSKATKPTA